MVHASAGSGGSGRCWWKPSIHGFRKTIAHLVQSQSRVSGRPRDASRESSGLQLWASARSLVRCRPRRGRRGGFIIVSVTVFGSPSSLGGFKVVSSLEKDVAVACDRDMSRSPRAACLRGPSIPPRRRKTALADDAADRHRGQVEQGCASCRNEAERLISLAKSMERPASISQGEPASRRG